MADKHKDLRTLIPHWRKNTIVRTGTPRSDVVASESNGDFFDNGGSLCKAIRHATDTALVFKTVDVSGRCLGTEEQTITAESIEVIFKK